MNRLLLHLMANKHTTGAGAVYAVSYGISELGAIWFPGHAAQFKATGDALQKMAVIYGLVMAGDANGKPLLPGGESAAEKPDSKTLKTMALVFGLLGFAISASSQTPN